MDVSTAQTETKWGTTDFVNVSYLKKSTITSNYFNTTEHGEKHFFAIVPLICGVIMTGVTFVGQTVVFIVTWNDERFRRPHNYYIISLAITDFLISIISMPIWTTYSALGENANILPRSLLHIDECNHCRMQSLNLTK